MKKIFLLTIFFVSSPYLLNAQRIDSLLNTYNLAAPKEKTYLHFDKSIYQPGETIWFKAYFLSGTELSNISKNFYLDWYGSDGQLLEHTCLPIFNAVTNGQFEIPPRFEGTYIHLRAYTSWMLNFDSAFLYEKDIPLVSTTTIPKKDTDRPQVSVRFFPEGGDLVNGISSVVAFEALTRHGNPASVKGAIHNHRGEFIDSFFPVHDGMGILSLEPVPGDTYSATWQDEWGNMGISVLPAAKTNGIVIEVVQQKTKIVYRIKSPPNTTENLKTLHVVAHMNQHFLYRAKMLFNDHSIFKSGSIPTIEMPTGVLQITVFDANWLPIAERVLFVNNGDYSFRSAITSKIKNTEKRGKNVLEIEIPDSISTNLSISVTDASLELTNNDNPIISQLLLTNEIRGRVTHPMYYFEKTSDSSSYYLDLVMLTHGWRRLNWEDVFSKKPVSLTYPMDSEYLHISGRVTASILNKVKNGEITLWLKPAHSPMQMLSLPITSEGLFSQSNLLFFDTIKVNYQITGQTELASGSKLTLDNGLLNKPIAGHLWNSTAPFTSENYFRTTQILRDQGFLSQVTLLPGVTVKGIIKTHLDSLDERYTGGVFKSENAFKLDPEKDRNLGKMNLLTFLQMHVAGIRQGVYINNNKARGAAQISEEGLFWRGNTGSMGAMNNLVQIFIDEQQTYYEDVKTMGLVDVAYIKVFRPPFVGGRFGAPGGAIAIYTNQGSAQSAAPGKETSVLTGYSTIREFYSPDYNDAEQLKNPTDGRTTTLYWLPNLKTDYLNNKIDISFFNNDTCKRWKIILEGVNAGGKLTRVEKIIE